MTVPTHADLMALDLPELRRRLVDHLEARPVDPFDRGMAEWIDTKGALTFAIDRKEGDLRSPAFLITVPPQPIEGLRVQPELDFKCMTPTRRHAGHEPNPHEEPMPMPRKYHTPEEKREAKNHRQRELRAKKKAAPAAATAPHASASPAAPAATRAAAPRAQGAAQPPAQGAGRPAPTHPGPGRLRALRSQALELLPLLEDMTSEESAAAHHEIDLLAKVLVLGGELIARRTA